MIVRLGESSLRSDSNTEFTEEMIRYERHDIITTGIDMKLLFIRIRQ
jgi:hypothetical protein